MKSRKKRRGFFLAVFLLIFLIAVGIGGYRLYKKLNTVQVNVVDEIDDFDYKLEDRDTELYKATFEELKEVLKEKEVDNEKLASSIAKLFIIDLYTIKNKVNKFDVGGLDFVFSSIKANYALNVQETLYKYVEDNSNKKRNQALPEVSEVTVNSIEAATFTVGGKTYNGYNINISWKYVTDLKYDTSAKLKLINDKDSYYVIELSH